MLPTLSRFSIFSWAEDKASEKVIFLHGEKFHRSSNTKSFFISVGGTSSWNFWHKNGYFPHESFKI